ncbi:Endoglucanase, partial [Globisporangium splendens]
MKRFAIAAAVLSTAFHQVVANPHPYTLPNQFPAGEPVETIVSTELQLESLESVTSLMSVSQQIERCNRYTFAAKKDGVYLNGEPFYIKGANFFGMETDILVPHGLWGGNDSTTIQKVATLLKANNFNTVRLPLEVNAVLNNPEINRNVAVNEVDLQAKFDGKTIYYFDVLDHVINEFAKNKIFVLLDAHVLRSREGITPLWYTSDADKTWFEDAWKILAARYKNTWNIIGADLKNEPHDEASWGSNDNNTDWRLASLQIGTSILEINPRWLIFVEGMQLSSRDDPTYPCFWGENLMDVQRAQLELPISERLVYSPHVYGPNVYGQPYFKDPTFPANMPAIWDNHFGFVKQYGAMVVGEWGGKFRDEDDITWQRAFAKYLVDKKLGWMYWCVNPNSGDTEGLLENDWNTPRYDKLELLSVFEGTRVP